MENAVRNMNDLRDRIALLENEERVLTASLRAGTGKLLQQLSPSGLLKKTLQTAAGAPQILPSLAGLLAGWLGKKWLAGSSSGPIHRLVGAVAGGLLATLLKKKMKRAAGMHKEANPG